MINIKKGFTLIELMVVISIIGLISSIVLVAVNSARGKARIAAGLQFAASVHHALGSEAVGIWDFDEGAGATSFKDYSGYNNNGSCSGASCPISGVTDTPSKTGYALSFDGMDDYVDVTQPMKFSRNSFSISFWIYISNASLDQTVLSEGAWAAGSRGWGIGFLSADQWWGGKSAYINFGYQFVGNGTVGLAKCNYAGRQNNWVHILSVKDFNTQTMALYLNGTFCELNYYSNMQLTETDDYQTSLKIGRNSWTSSAFLSGFIDGVRIYGQTLSEAQIKQLYAEGAARHGLLAEE